MNELQIITAGAGEEEVKIYTGRTSARPRYERDFPSADPVFVDMNSRRNRESFYRAGARVSVRDRIRAAVERLNISDEAQFFVLLAAKYLLIFAVIVGYTAAAYGIGASRADKAARAEAAQQYAAELQAYIQERDAAEEAARLATKNAAQSDADMIARVLYGMKDSSTAALRTLTWCIFNRVDNPRFPNSIAEVITEDGQFSMYSPDYPVLEDLYQIAAEEMDKWKSDVRRPVSSDYVYMSWSPSGITIRDKFEETGETRTWSYS